MFFPPLPRPSNPLIVCGHCRRNLPHSPAEWSLCFLAPTLPARCVSPPQGFLEVWRPRFHLPLPPRASAPPHCSVLFHATPQLQGAGPLLLCFFFFWRSIGHIFTVPAPPVSAVTSTRPQYIHCPGPMWLPHTPLLYPPRPLDPPRPFQPSPFPPPKNPNVSVPHTFWNRFC